LSRVIKSFRTEDDKDYILNPFSVISERVKVNSDAFVLDEDGKKGKGEDRHHKSPAFSVVDDAESQADAILAQAHQQAAQIVSQAQAEAQQMKSEAVASGQAQGIKEGMEEGLQNFRVAIQQAEELMRDAQGNVQLFFDEAEDAIYAMALAMAELIINYKIDSENEIVVNIAKRLVEKARNGKRFTLKCNPLDVPILSESMDLLTAATGGKDIELDDDRNISRGGCRLETDYGVLDGTMESQLEQLRRLVEDTFDEG
jgi:flagellar assembly protein FliH